MYLPSLAECAQARSSTMAWLWASSGLATEIRDQMRTASLLRPSSI